MERKNIVPFLFVTSTILVLVGAFIKIMHWPGSDFLMLLGLAAHVAFLIITIKEISTSKNIKNNDKVLWYFGLIFFTTVVGLIYILNKRNNTINYNQLTQN